jgi:tetratricopeptide (TPR) repeat protein
VRELEAVRVEKPVVDRTVTGRAAPAHIGKVIHVDFRAGGAQTAYDLYKEASKLDENVETRDAAESLYLRALALEPKMAIARCNLGNIYFRRGRLDLAAVEYDQAIKDDPNCPEAHYNRGYLHLDRGNPRAATSYFLTAIKLDPAFADAYFNCGMALEELGDKHTAQWHWKKYLECEPNGQWSNLARSHLLPETPQKRTRKPRAVKGQS